MEGANVTVDDEYVSKYGDPRQQTWFLMSSSIPTILISALYLVIVKALLPAYMRYRKPYNLKAVLVPYNLMLVVFSAWVFLNILRLIFLDSFSWRCEPMDYSDNPDSIRMAEIFWYIFMSKFIELADTVFFVLRKKDSQVTTLHLIHHSFVPIDSYFGVKYGPGGYNFIFPFTNTFVHIFMYLYYGLAAIGPSMQQYLWWKKYITKMQMLQFVIVALYYAQAYFIPVPGCKVSGLLFMVNVAPAVGFFGLFADFYLQAYRKTTHKSA